MKRYDFKPIISACIRLTKFCEFTNGIPLNKNLAISSPDLLQILCDIECLTDVFSFIGNQKVLAHLQVCRISLLSKHPNNGTSISFTRTETTMIGRSFSNLTDFLSNNVDEVIFSFIHDNTTSKLH